MIQVNSLIAIFVVEALVGLLLLTLAFTFFLLRRRTRERDAARELINRLQQSESERAETMSRSLGESCERLDLQLDEVLAEIGEQEKTLYRQIVKMFLARDAAMLKEIDCSVQGLSAPFFRMIADLGTASAKDSVLVEARESAESEVRELKKESTRLTAQLDMAMRTMDEVSCEYSKMFGSTRDSEELNMSRMRMLNAFRDAERQLREASAEYGHEPPAPSEAVGA